MSENNSARISVVHPSQFSPGTSQTSGSQRLAAICGELGVTSGMWGGTFQVEPGARTGIHHHGSQETIVYVLEGESFVQWGERGEHSATVRAGDFLHVPGWTATPRNQPFEGQAVPLGSHPQHIRANRSESP